MYLSLAGSGRGDDQMVVELSQGVDILVATPACLERMQRRGKLDWSRMRQLVLDDADELFDKHFDSVCVPASTFNRLLLSERNFTFGTVTRRAFAFSIQ